MAAAEQIPVEYLSDKVAEKNFAEMVGTTRRALQGKRQRNIIPKGVWNEIDGQIYYSIRRYEAWLESLRYHVPNGRHEPRVHCESARPQRANAAVDIRPVDQFQ